MFSFYIRFLSLLFKVINKQIFIYIRLCYPTAGNLCQVTNLTTDSNNVLFGNVKLPGGGGLHVFTSDGALQFLRNNNQVC